MWPKMPLERRRHHCAGCLLEHIPQVSCDLTHRPRCSRWANCTDDKVRCLEGILAVGWNTRCCCSPNDGIGPSTSCKIVHYWHRPHPFLYERGACILKCCDYAECGTGCCEEGEGCGKALIPFTEPCCIGLNVSVPQQMSSSCCLANVGVSCSSGSFEPCCLARTIRVTDSCQARQVDCLPRPVPSPTTTPPATPTQLNMRYSLVVGCIGVAILLTVCCVFSRWYWRLRRLRGLTRQQPVERLLSVDGLTLPLTEVKKPTRRGALVISNQRYHEGYAALWNSHSDGEKILAFFQELNYDHVQHLRDLQSTADFWQCLSEFLRLFNGLTGVLVVIYYVGHAVQHAGEVHLAMTAAKKTKLCEEHHLSQVMLQLRLRDIHDRGEAERLHGCPPLPEATIVGLVDCCRTACASALAAKVGQDALIVSAKRIQKQQRPRFAFIYVCEPWCKTPEECQAKNKKGGHFTREFLQLARRPQPLRCLYLELNRAVEYASRGPRQQRVCCHDDAALEGIYISHPADTCVLGSSDVVSDNTKVAGSTVNSSSIF